MTVHTHCDFIVQPQWDTRLVVPFHSDALSWHQANQSLPYPNNAECHQQVSILKSLVRLDQRSNPHGPDSNPTRFRFPNLSAWGMDALLIRPPHLILMKHNALTSFFLFLMIPQQTWLKVGFFSTSLLPPKLHFHVLDSVNWAVGAGVKNMENGEEREITTQVWQHINKPHDGNEWNNPTMPGE